MRRPDTTQHAMFSYRTLEERIPANHPLRKLRVLVVGILASMYVTFEQLYSRTGRQSIPPERLLRASLIQVLFSIRSERQWVQHIEYNLLYRWFVGLSMDDDEWAATTFTESRERLFTEAVMGAFFGKVLALALAQCKKLVSNEHFTVDGTLIDAWSSHKSFGLRMIRASRRKAAARTRPWISKERSAATTPTPRPATRKPGSSRRAKGTNPGSATWGMR